MKRAVIVLTAALFLFSCSCGKTENNDADKMQKEAEQYESEQIIVQGDDADQTVEMREDTGTDTANARGNTGGGEEGECKIHVESLYHTIPYTLIDKVGNDRFREWIASLPDDYNENGCTDPFSLVRFLRDFNFTPEEITEFVYGPNYYNLYGDIESLCAGDFDKYEESVKRTNYDADDAQRLSSEQSIKIRILLYLKDSGNDEWVELYNTITKDGQFSYTHTWSIPEIVYKPGITQDVLEDALHKIHYNEFLNCTIPTFDYDFSLIYEGDGLYSEIEELRPVQVDELLRVKDS